MKKTVYKNIILAMLMLGMCLMATGCMGGQKDITKADEEKYEAVVAEACEEFGYEYEKQTVFPLGSELLYLLSDGESDEVISVTIDEESTYDGVNFEFEITREAGGSDDYAAEAEKHLGVLAKIAEHFTEDVTRDVLAEALKDSSCWEADEEDGEESFYFSWDNGKKYKDK